MNLNSCFDWRIIYNQKTEPTTSVECPKCSRKTIYHSKFVAAGIAQCVLRGCKKLADVAKSMVEYRGGKYKDLVAKGNKMVVRFICSGGHVCSLNYINLRQGANCRKCQMKKEPDDLNKCDCITVRSGICIHNNLKITHPELITEWSPSNKILPTEISFGSNIKVDWICNKHPELETYFVYSATPNNRINGKGCTKCDCPYDPRYEGYKTFRKVSLEIHNLKYELPSKEEYDESYERDTNRYHVNFTCKEHGLFFQTIYHHLEGYGCQKCTPVSKGIEHITKILRELDIDFEREIKLPNLKYINPLSIDIRLTKSGLIIEYDGRHHFEIIEYWGGEKEYVSTRTRDLIKDLYCVKNKYSIWRIPHWQYKITKEDILIMINHAEKNQIYVSYESNYEMIKTDADFTGIDIKLIHQPK